MPFKVIQGHQIVVPFESSYAIS